MEFPHDQLVIIIETLQILEENKIIHVLGHLVDKVFLLLSTDFTTTLPVYNFIFSVRLSCINILIFQWRHMW